MKNTRFAARLALAVPLLILGASYAPATTIRRTSFENHVASSTSIIHGRVLATTPVFPDRGIAHTIAHVVVESAAKSDGPDVAPGALVEVRLPGARDATRWVRVDGAPALAPDQEVVLFLWREPTTGHQLVYAWSHGTYHVVRDASTGRDRLSGLYAEAADTPDDFLARVQVELARVREAAEGRKPR